MQEITEVRMESNEERYRRAAETSDPPRPKNPRPIVVLGAGGIVRAAHLPAYAKAGFPVIAIVDSATGKAAELATEKGIAHSFDSIQEAVHFAPSDAIFDIAVPASQIMTILPQLPSGAAVLLQKPMGETLEEATAIRDHCRQRGLVAAVNFQLRYSPNNLAALALERAGLIGELHDMEVHLALTHRGSSGPSSQLHHGWRFSTTASTTSTSSAPGSATPRASTQRQFETRRPRRSQPPSPRSYWTTVSGSAYLSSRITATIFRRRRTAALCNGKTGGAIRMDMGVNLDYPKGVPDTLSYAERGSSNPQWIDLPVKGNWFPDAFVGSMGALQSYVEGSIAELPIGFESAYETMALVEAAYRSSAWPAEPVPL